MSDPLFPTWAMPQTVGEAQRASTSVQYGNAPRFDFEAGDMVLDGAGRVELLDGLDSWVQWCVKAILCERYSALVQPRSYGTELDSALRQSQRLRQQAEIERTVTEALLVDPRTKTVTDFSFEWEADRLTLGFTLVPTIGDPRKEAVTIG